MKVRQVKLQHHARSWFNFQVKRLYSQLEMPFAKFTEFEVGQGPANCMLVAKVEAESETALQKEFRLIAEAGKQSACFTVARKKDGAVVGIYETQEEAEAVILKAKQQKKAALQLA